MAYEFARSMLASVFTADGVDTLMDQKDHEEGIYDLIARVHSVTPSQYNKYVPRSEETVAQVIVGIRAVAGSLYVLGKAPRLSATALVAVQVLTVLARHAFWEAQNLKEKATHRAGSLIDIGLLGSLFPTTADTDDKPGVV